MKRILLLLTLVIVHFTGKSQVNLEFLKSIIRLSSFEKVDSILNKAGYPFKNVQKNSCNTSYTFEKGIYEGIGYYQTFVVSHGCLPNTPAQISKVRFLTRNDKLFHAIKEECKQISGIKSNGEIVNWNAVTVEYQQGILVFDFTNTKDENGSAFVIDLKLKIN
jgi:hypothetical protein